MTRDKGRERLDKLIAIEKQRIDNNKPKFFHYVIGWFFLITVFPAFFALLGFGTKSPFGRVKHINKRK
jgi:hypothetical protein